MQSTCAPSKVIPFAFLAVSLLVSILVSELVMRCYMFGADAWSYTKMRSIRHVGRSGIIQASEHQDILWELRPNLDTMYKLKEFRTNSYGLRDREYALAKPEGVTRVAVIGDSYTMGEGVAIEDVYHSVLEARLNATAGRERFEFLNFGVAGYSLPQYRATIEHRVAAFKPDLILIGFCAANDSKKPNLDAFNQPYKVQSVANGFYHFFFFEHVGNVYRRAYRYIRGRKPGYNADGTYLNGEFDKLEALTSRLGVPVVIAYLDNRAPSADFEMVREATARHRWPFVLGTNGFTDTLDSAHIIYVTDGHPNGAANRIIAESLYQELQPHLLQIQASRL